MLLTRIAIVLMLCASFAYAKPPRSAAEVMAFKRHNPCPATGERRGSCPGFIVDHVVPLCAGGADDHKTNMQWQSVEDAKAKDRLERRMCRKLESQ